MHDEELPNFFDPVYKGCIDPPTIFGVPMLPFLGGVVIFAHIALAAFVFAGPGGLVVVGGIFAIVLHWARGVGKNDSQRLQQTFKRLQIRLAARHSRSVWGAVSFGPCRRETLR